MILIGIMLVLSGCCGPLLSAYEAQQRACLARYEDPDEAQACVQAVRLGMRPELDRYGCD